MAKTYSKTRILVECALMIAVGTVLANVKIYELPNGGSVTLLSMLPFVLISFRHGVKWGVFTGFVNSLLQMLLGFWAPPVPTFLSRRWAWPGCLPAPSTTGRWAWPSAPSRCAFCAFCAASCLASSCGAT